MTNATRTPRRTASAAKAAAKAHAEANSTIGQAVKAAKAKTATPAPAKGKKAAAPSKKATPAKAAKKAAPKKAAKPDTACLCGCGTTGKGTYRPGHDARHAGRIAREIVEAGSDLEANQIAHALGTLGSDALRAKATAMIARLQKQAAIKALRAQAKADLEALLATV